jgi:hypothetical protein
MLRASDVMEEIGQWPTPYRSAPPLEKLTFASFFKKVLPGREKRPIGPRQANLSHGPR